jgi:hypothetical protein
MRADQKTIPLLEEEILLEREAKVKKIGENVRLKALNKKLTLGAITDNTIKNEQGLEIIKLKSKSFNNLFIGGAIGITGSALIIYLLK